MLLADELEAEPIYVINNGISHQESVAPSKILPFLIETLDALEFITGPETSEWGAVRASMGRKEPWKLDYLAIGNEVSHASNIINCCLLEEASYLALPSYVIL